MNKKGEGKIITEVPSGGAAAVVLAIITLILVLYVVFLPPADRAELLGDDATRLGEFNVTLFEASVGTIDFSDETTVEHRVPNLLLIESKNAAEFESYNPFIVAKSWFGKKTEVLAFHIEDPKLVQNVFVSFDATKRKGPLRILVNGNVVFEGEPQSTNVGPIEIRDHFLKTDNEIVFETGGVGLAFWRKHVYNIENAKIIGDVTDEATQESLNTFVLSDGEVTELERAQLDYFVVCQEEGGAMNAFLNNRRISSGVPLCDSPNRIELDVDDVVPGKNSLFFKIDSGAYRLEDITLKLQLREPVPFLDYFEVSDEDFESLRRGTALVRIEFIDDDKEKVGEVSINGRRSRIQQTENEFSRVINGQLEPGQNYIQITPETTLRIAQLEVVIE